MNLNSLIQKIGEAAPRFGKKPQVIAPPMLRAPARGAYGPFRFKAQLPKSVAYTVHASTDLKTWDLVSSDTAKGEMFEFVDSDAFKFSYRFYRMLAGQVASRNVVGYVSITLPPGFSMIANPLQGSNSVAEVFKGWPDGTLLNRFDTRLFRLTENGLNHGKWTNPGEKLAHGEGGIFFNPSWDYKSVSFVGEVMQGSLSMPIPSGFSVRSSLIPQPGNLDDLGFPIANGDVIHLFDRDRQQYALHPYENGRWTAGPPVVSVGESFWVAKTDPGNWTQALNIG